MLSWPFVQPGPRSGSSGQLRADAWPHCLATCCSATQSHRTDRAFQGRLTSMTLSPIISSRSIHLMQLGPDDGHGPIDRSIPLNLNRFVAFPRGQAAIRVAGVSVTSSRIVGRDERITAGTVLHLQHLHLLGCFSRPTHPPDWLSSDVASAPKAEAAVQSVGCHCCQFSKG